MMCTLCGEQEAVQDGICLDCRHQLMDEEHVFIPDSPSLCNCEDRPCCGCNN